MNTFRVIALLVAALLSACGGGSEPLNSHDKTIIPVTCPARGASVNDPCK